MTRGNFKLDVHRKRSRLINMKEQEEGHAFLGVKTEEKDGRDKETSQKNAQENVFISLAGNVEQFTFSEQIIEAFQP